MHNHNEKETLNLAKFKAVKAAHNRVRREIMREIETHVIETDEAIALEDELSEVSNQIGKLQHMQSELIARLAKLRFQQLTQPPR